MTPSGKGSPIAKNVEREGDLFSPAPLSSAPLSSPYQCTPAAPAPDSTRTTTVTAQPVLLPVLAPRPATSLDLLLPHPAMSKKVAAPAAAEENIKVVIRCRPLSKTEIQNQNKTYDCKGAYKRRAAAKEPENGGQQQQQEHNTGKGEHQ